MGKLVGQAHKWRWSRAAAHFDRADDGFTALDPVLSLVPDWTALFDDGRDEPALKTIRCYILGGRPLGSAAGLVGVRRL